MFEIVIVLGIVGAAAVFLVRHFVRGARGTAACSGCACSSQGCHSGALPVQRSMADLSGSARISGGDSVGSRGHHAPPR